MPPLRWRASAPEDPSLPSFLTRLPQEIHSMVYEAMLPCSGKIKPATCKPWTWFDEQQRGYRKLIENEKLPNALPMGLMLSCRQIHFEFAQTLYRNSWVLLEGSLGGPVWEKGKKTESWQLVPIAYQNFLRRVHFIPETETWKANAAPFHNFHLTTALAILEQWPTVLEILIDLSNNEMAIRELRYINEVAIRKEDTTKELVRNMRTVAELNLGRFPKSLKIGIFLGSGEIVVEEGGDDPREFIEEAIRRVEKLKRL